MTRMVEEVVVVHFKVLPKHFSEGNEHQKTLNHKNRYTSRDSNPGPPEYGRVPRSSKLLSVKEIMRQLFECLNFK